MTSKRFPGTWDDEPDDKEWTNKASGYLCLLHRAPHPRTWAGYVVLEKGHPFYEWGGSLWDIPVEVHYGVSFSRFWSKEEEAKGWWRIGFDCNHLGDYAPGEGHACENESYRDINYATAECDRLAEQLGELANKGVPMTNETRDLTIEERLERLEDFAAINRTLLEYIQRRFMGKYYKEVEEELLGNVTVHQDLWGLSWMMEASKRMKKKT